MEPEIKVEEPAKESTFLCPWCEEQCPVESQCSSGLCRGCNGWNF